MANGAGTAQSIQVRLIECFGDVTHGALEAELSAVRSDDATRFLTAMLKRGWAPLRGVIVGRDKYIELPIEELYDLGEDPEEMDNLVARSGERVRTLVSHLKALGATMPGEQADENAEVRARLQALGYVSGSAPRKATYTEEDDPKRLIEQAFDMGAEFPGPAEDLLLSWILSLPPDADAPVIAALLADRHRHQVAELADKHPARRLLTLLEQTAAAGAARASGRRGGRRGKS